MNALTAYTIDFPLLDAENSSEEPTLTALQARYTLVQASTWTHLAEALQSQEKALVVFPASLASVAQKVLKVKSLLKTATCLVQLEREDVERADPEAMALNDTVFILNPATAFELDTALTVAERLCDLQQMVSSATQWDDATELFNRRYFTKRLADEMSLAKRHLSPVSCVVIGLQYYQVFLDSYGYAFMVGFLKHIADVVRKQVRQEDSIARLSDDEIAILLPRSSEKGAQILTERIVEALESTPYKMIDAEEYPTVYAGIASFSASDEEGETSADSVIRFAQHALHQAKCHQEKVQRFGQIRPRV